MMLLAGRRGGWRYLSRSETMPDEHVARCQAERVHPVGWKPEESENLQISLEKVRRPARERIQRQGAGAPLPGRHPGVETFRGLPSHVPGPPLRGPGGGLRLPRFRSGAGSVSAGGAGRTGNVARDALNRRRSWHGRLHAREVPRPGGLGCGDPRAWGSGPEFSEAAVCRSGGTVPDKAENRASVIWRNGVSGGA